MADEQERRTHRLELLAQYEEKKSRGLSGRASSRTNDWRR